MKRKILIVVLCLACVTSYAQRRRKPKPKPTPPPVAAPTTPSTVTSAKPAVDTTKKIAAVPAKPFDRPLDGYYKKSNILNAKVTPYPNLRESDVAYAKRIWREIDVREKMNTYMVSAKQRLIDVLMSAINAGELTAYDATPNEKSHDDPDGDAFTKPLTAVQAYNTLVDSVGRIDIDKDGNKTVTKVPGEFKADSILKFRLKEDWVFDKQRSIFEPRIIGIAPMKKVKENNNEFQPAFWVYFPDARPILATKEVASSDNDNTGLSYDDIFMKRIFTSYIVKQSNDKNDRIKDYMTGIDKLYEAERIKKSLMDWELNLWQY
jgi:gliding motility associated protien GldN